MTETFPDPENNTTSEAKILSFIVRVWREESANKNSQAIWRGFVYSVPNGERLYFSDVKKIPGLIVAYLKGQP